MSFMIDLLRRRRERAVCEDIDLMYSVVEFVSIHSIYIHMFLMHHIYEAGAAVPYGIALTLSMST